MRNERVRAEMSLVRQCYVGREAGVQERKLEEGTMKQIQARQGWQWGGYTVTGGYLAIHQARIPN